MADPGLTTTEIERLFGPGGKIRALLAIEAALARAQARESLIPASAAEAIQAACNDLEFDAETLVAEGWETGTPMLPILARLRTALPEEHRDQLHLGSTSQDIIDTALMWRVSEGIEILTAALTDTAQTCADLAQEHRSTVMTARTFLQAARPTTFGARAADWLNSLTGRVEALRALSGRLTIQMGGPVGTGADPGGERVAELLAESLGLTRPASPWHTDRQPVIEVGVTIASVAGAAEKIAADVMLLAQSEVAEVRVRAGGSSSMSHKRNPVDAMHALAAGTAARSHASAMVGAPPPRLERDAGDWPVEWERVGAVLGATTAAVRAAGRCLGSLEVDADRMQANLSASLVDVGLDLAGATTFVDRALDRYERAAASG